MMTREQMSDAEMCIPFYGEEEELTEEQKQDNAKMWESMGMDELPF